MKLLGISIYGVHDLVVKASRACAPQPTTGLELWRRRGMDQAAFLPTSLSLLDRVLSGGIPTGIITEIAGPSGCGKTQLSIMLSVLTTLPTTMGGLDGGVIYIDTESAFSPERLVEIAEHRFPQHFSQHDALMKLTTSVHVYQESSSKGLLSRLQSLEEEIIEKQARLIILDSVASLVRKEYDNQSGQTLSDRSNLLTQQAAILKYLAEAFNIPVVVTNQITTRFRRPSPGAADAGGTDGGENAEEEADREGDGSYVTAALGNTWSHSVNTRLIVQYLDGPLRQILVAKSPLAPFAAFTYTIETEGLVLQEGGADHYEGTDPGLQHIQVRSAVPQQWMRE